MSKVGGGSGNWLDLILLLNRLALGWYFLMAGIAKIQGGVAVFYRDNFLVHKPQWVPDWLGSLYGYTLPYLEVLVGATLALGLGRRWPAGLISVMLLSFIIAFSDTATFSGKPGTFHNDIVFFALALLLTTLGSGAFSLDVLLHRSGSKSVTTAR